MLNAWNSVGKRKHNTSFYNRLSKRFPLNQRVIPKLFAEQFVYCLQRAADQAMHICWRAFWVADLSSLFQSHRSILSLPQLEGRLVSQSIVKKTCRFFTIWQYAAYENTFESIVMTHHRGNVLIYCPLWQGSLFSLELSKNAWTDGTSAPCKEPNQ